ncbi:MAG: patatin-like phospholipase family protein [Thermoleophilaceae bacterium]|nr:patatin-like phospholipase family protein [Thermoleophilaceae bacterium]MDQ3240670.1 patatin-like phospholipase family protein [Actinomycetota bacterium]MDQ3319666.1 patatin-like phospholipase family protein [Actinomycetota bacterium]MDQ3355755.1 patatin-like phospholipase family protein [Actinomycetota bacterium]
MSAGRKTAFILAGGGSRGAYQAGCLRRLEEEGIEPDLIVGSSIGVCNSLVYATSGAEALWEFWSRTVALPRILKPSLRRNALFGNSLFSMSGLTDLIESEVDFDRCFDSETELTYVVANLSAGREEMRGNRTESDVERFRTVSRIGYAIPILHPLIELDGDLYADGGFLWNVPFEYAEDWGADEIFILSVVPSELPRANSLRLLPQVALRMYDILWRTLGNSSHLEKRLEGGRWDGIDLTVIEPGHETGMFDPLGMLNAHPGKSKRLLWQGYRDTDEVLRGGRPRTGRVKGSGSPEPARHPRPRRAAPARGAENGGPARTAGSRSRRR